MYKYEVGDRFKLGSIDDIVIAKWQHAAVPYLNMYKIEASSGLITEVLEYDLDLLKKKGYYVSVVAQKHKLIKELINE